MGKNCGITSSDRVYRERATGTYSHLMDYHIILSILAILVLLVFSAFFSGSETALTAASRARMHARAREGDRRAALVGKIRDQKEKMIGALLLGNNLVNILASALATSVLIDLFDEGGVFVATIIMTIMILIFSEVLPKTYAFYDSDRMAMVVAPMIRVLIVLFAPPVVLVSKVVKLILRGFGVDISHVRVGDHAEALRGMIEMHHGPEAETNQQRAMLRSIMDLADVEVCEVMTHRRTVLSLDIGAPPEALVDQAFESPYTRIPVWEDSSDNIIGIIHTKHLMRAIRDLGGDVAKLDVRKLLTAPWFIPEGTTLFDQLQAFRERREHFAIVVDEYGSYMGIVTLEDILEEIVGDIDDEYDIPMPGVHKLPGGVLLVDGTVTIRDLNRAFEWSLPDQDYTTVAGLVLFESRRIPDIGQSFTFHGFRFDILRRLRNQITLVRVTPPRRGVTPG